jgi:hypothetical protein
LVLGLGLVELGFWMRDSGAFPHLNVYEPDPAYGARLRPLSTTRVAFGGSAVTEVAIHGGGFRGERAEPEPPVRQNEVLFVGDSQTFGLGVEANESFVARFGELAKVPVYNAGVPTWGPPEFARAIAEIGKRRRPKRVVYVVNFANDPFEANRKNVERHAVWDGWAVRRETAPASVFGFPGRELLFGRSHAVFALRQWLYFRGEQQRNAEEGTISEGTFRDLFDIGQAVIQQRAQDRAETERRAALYETEATYADERYRRAESRVKALVWQSLKLGDVEYRDTGSQGSVYLAADANPGDIVTPGYGEEGRPVFATAEYIRKGVEFRNSFEAKLRAEANAAVDSASGKEFLSALSARDAERLRRDVVTNKPLEIVRHASPLARAVLEAKEQARAIGAELTLLVLPLDVMVSPEEWKKHGEKRVDLAPAQVLIDDLVEVVRGAGAVAVDAGPTLKKAQPGAFLPGDIHLTPKGHEAVAKALAEAIEANGRSLVSAHAPVLDKGRSRVPPPSTWPALAGEVAVRGSGPRCPVTKKYREWLYVTCYPKRAAEPTPIGARVLRGSVVDSIVSVNDGRLTLVAPIPKDQPYEAVFTWSDGASKRLIVEWDPAGAAPDMRMVQEPTERAEPPASPDASAKICGCFRRETNAEDCRELIAQPDPDCAAAYAGDCTKMLACAEGHALYPPRCAPGRVNVGATQRCTSAQRASAGSSAGGALPALALAPAPLSEADKKTLADKGHALIVSAQAFVGEGCKLGGDAIELLAVVPFDRCPVDARMVKDYEAALGAFDAIASRAALDGKAATYAEKARLFGSWVNLTLQSKDTRGTSALYQDLALSFNAWQPEKRVWVDSPRMVNLYFGLSGNRGDDYLRNHRNDGEKRRAAWLATGKHFSWRRGPNGFEGPYGSPDERWAPGGL